MRLCVENVCEIVGGEKEQTRQEAREVLIDHTRFTDDDLKRIVLDNREDVVLDIVSSNKQRLAGIIYGEGHNWDDNIMTWNTKHPDKKFALIEVMPKSIVEDEDYWSKNTDPLKRRLARLK